MFQCLSPAKSSNFLECSDQTLHKNRWSFPLRISSVNVTKSTVSCNFFTFTEEILNGKLHFLCCEGAALWIEGIGIQTQRLVSTRFTEQISLQGSQWSSALLEQKFTMLKPRLPRLQWPLICLAADQYMTHITNKELKQTNTIWIISQSIFFNIWFWLVESLLYV